ncbi:F-box protein [Sporobolomyces salmoneus]|uniref:F-box protein n=1 Tax=Sporobolomyces salmoneus TaxID=183962 RepID=UPI003174BAE1
MSKASLPTELIRDILSRDLLDQSDLALLSRTSKLLSTIAKPILYRSVIIQSRRQLDQLVSGAREEDAIKEVKRVDVVGKGNAWEIEEIVDVRSDFGSLDDNEKTERVAGCAKELIEGRSVNSDKIEAIYIRNVVEDPNVVWKKGFKVDGATFASLKDFSLVSYRGGLNVAAVLLQHQYLPKLERLVLCDVTYTDPGGPVPIDDGLFMLTSAGGMPLCRMLDPSDYECLEVRLEDGCDLFDQLQLLVSPSFDVFDKYPNLLHLALLTSRYSLRLSDQYAIVYVSTRPTAANEIVPIFLKLSEIANDLSNYSLEYLALPRTFQGRLLESETSILDNLEALGVEIHYDGDLGRSMAPKSFFDHLKKKKEEEDARNAILVE